MLHHLASSNMTIAQYVKLSMHNTSAFLGLKNHLSENTSQEILRQREAIGSAVIVEQRHQVHTGVHNPAVLVIIARGLSKKLTKCARIIGLLHAKSW